MDEIPVKQQLEPKHVQTTLDVKILNNNNNTKYTEEELLHSVIYI